MAPSSETARRRRRLYPGVAVAAVIAAGTTVAGVLNDREDRDRAVPGVQSSERIDPLAYDPADDDALTARAAAGHSHVLYAKSPGGLFATARRVERHREDIEAAAGDSDGVVDADTLEALVFLESGGRTDVVAGDGDPENAAGLTQILAETGQGLLGMKVDLARSRALTRTARRARRRGRPAAARRALAVRRRVDERFVPRKALAATVRYLRTAHGELGRDDLALVSYHMGIGNLQQVIADYGAAGEGDEPSYVRLFFDSTPQRHAQAWRRLSALGDDSSTYYWRVLAAKAIMRLWREDRAELQRLEELQTNKASAEEVLHPPGDTESFADPGAIEDARDDGDLQTLPRDLGFRLDRRMGELAARVDAEPALYRALRPEAVTLARWMGAKVQEISGVPRPLTMTSAVRDQRYQELLVGKNIEATSGYSLHTTGYAFDVLRRYPSRSQAVAFQFLLDRLQSLNLIAWVREPAAIHVTVAKDAGKVSDPS